MLALLLLVGWQPQACRDAATLLESGKIAAAQPALIAAAAANPESSYCAKALGVLHATQRDYRAAEAPFRRACQLNAAEPDACYYSARALYSLDRFEESLAALARAAPGSTKAWRLAAAEGQALDALGRLEAEAVLRKALAERERDPAPISEPDPLLALAAFLYREGRGGESLALLNGAGVRYQHVAVYHYQRGRALAQGLQWEQATAALEQAVALNDAYAEAHGLLSRCYYRLGKTELAERHTARARQGPASSR